MASAAAQINLLFQSSASVAAEIDNVAAVSTGLTASTLSVLSESYSSNFRRVGFNFLLLITSLTNQTCPQVPPEITDVPPSSCFNATAAANSTSSTNSTSTNSTASIGVQARQIVTIISSLNASLSNFLVEINSLRRGCRGASVCGCPNATDLLRISSGFTNLTIELNASASASSSNGTLIASANATLRANFTSAFQQVGVVLQRIEQCTICLRGRQRNGCVRAIKQCNDAKRSSSDASEGATCKLRNAKRVGSFARRIRKAGSIRRNKRRQARKSKGRRVRDRCRQIVQDGQQMSRNIFEYLRNIAWITAVNLRFASFANLTTQIVNSLSASYEAMNDNVTAITDNLTSKVELIINTTQSSIVEESTALALQVISESDTYPQCGNYSEAALQLTGMAGEVFGECAKLADDFADNVMVNLTASASLTASGFNEIVRRHDSCASLIATSPIGFMIWAILGRSAASYDQCRSSVSYFFIFLN
jgi:hypothetical protein